MSTRPLLVRVQLRRSLTRERVVHWQFASKYVLDRVIALLALIALAPLLLAIAAAVRLSSPGPALYRQRRVGLDGRVFEMLKFRSMIGPIGGGLSLGIEAGIAPGGVEGVDRRTRIGRWLRAISFDELPQLLNILRGEMALIGPRPERPCYVEWFAANVPGYAERHCVKPGITGWAQVHGLRGQTSITARTRHDNFYIEHWSPALELRILALTVVEVLRMRDRTARTPSSSRPGRLMPASLRKHVPGRLLTRPVSVVHGDSDRRDGGYACLGTSRGAIDASARQP